MKNGSVMDLTIETSNFNRPHKLHGGHYITDDCGVINISLTSHFEPKGPFYAVQAKYKGPDQPNIAAILKIMEWLAKPVARDTEMLLLVDNHKRSRYFEVFVLDDGTVTYNDVTSEQDNLVGRLI